MQAVCRHESFYKPMISSCSIYTCQVYHLKCVFGDCHPSTHCSPTSIDVLQCHRGIVILCRHWRQTSTSFITMSLWHINGPSMSDWLVIPMQSSGWSCSFRYSLPAYFSVLQILLLISDILFQCNQVVGHLVLDILHPHILLYYNNYFFLSLTNCSNAIKWLVSHQALDILYPHILLHFKHYIFLSLTYCSNAIKWLVT